MFPQGARCGQVRLAFFLRRGQVTFADGWGMDRTGHVSLRRRDPVVSRRRFAGLLARAMRGCTCRASRDASVALATWYHSAPLQLRGHAGLYASPDIDVGGDALSPGPSMCETSSTSSVPCSVEPVRERVHRRVCVDAAAVSPAAGAYVPWPTVGRSGVLELDGDGTPCPTPVCVSTSGGDDVPIGECTRGQGDGGQVVGGALSIRTTSASGPCPVASPGSRASTGDEACDASWFLLDEYEYSPAHQGEAGGAVPRPSAPHEVA